tara:strand:+ start:1537 stop:2541 length:1005 start_codon:yes stop_codon:yes gene_type:complete
MLKIHKLCECLPEMESQAFEELKNSIAKNGQRKPIITIGNEILMGRHRYKACSELGIPPHIRAYDPERDGANLTETVIDDDLRRRHLSPGQRAAVYAVLMQYAAEEVVDTPEQTDGEPAAPAEAADPADEADDLDIEFKNGGGTGVSTDAGKDKTKTDSEQDGVGDDHAEGKLEKAAREAGVSPNTLSQAKQVLKSRPDLIKKVIDKEMTLNQAKQLMKSEDPAVAQDRAEAADILSEELGDEFTAAIRDNTILKGDELKEFIKISAALRAQVQDLIVESWKVTDAVKYVRGLYLQQDTIGDMINRFIQIGKATSKIVVDGYEVTVRKAKEGSK